MLKKALWMMIFMMKKLSQTVHDHFISILLCIYIYISYIDTCVYRFLYSFLF